jgi:squalene synthase HpnC
MRAVSVDHYENFPVASWLCPRRLRPAVASIYWYARTADDLADEGSHSREQRLLDLSAYRAELQAAANGRSADRPRWHGVFEPLRRTLQAHRLPLDAFTDLLSAFEQDTGNPLYQDRAELLDYSRRSANPIGRLLLSLYGVDDTRSLQQSDAICSALQLVNFWQDLSVDSARGRCYVPLADARLHGVDVGSLKPGADTPATRALVASLCDWSEALMRSGAPLALRLPGRFGWELRLVVQGGLGILEKIRRMNHATLTHRPTLTGRDAPRLLARAIGMSFSGRTA